MTSFDDDAERAEVRDMLGAAARDVHARPGLADRAITGHRRRRRAMLAATGALTVLVAGGAALAVTLPAGHGKSALITNDNASPSPTTAALLDACAPRHANEVAITPNGTSPYLSAPPPGAAAAAVTRAAAVRAVRRSDAGAALANATVELRTVREAGAGTVCTTSVAWVAYGHPDPLSVVGGSPNDACVVYVVVDARSGTSSGERTVCVSHAPPNCSPDAQGPRRSNGFGRFVSFAGRYRDLPATTGAWTKLPRVPLSTRSDPVVVWAGDQLVVWGGQSGAHGSTVLSDGASYDPVSRRWTMLPSAPISGRTGAAAVWTGSELVVWGGYDDLSGIGRIHVSATGAAYNPATRAWRLLPKAPLRGARDPGIAWTGAEVVVLDGQPAVLTNAVRGWRQAAAWNPMTNRWRALPSEPAGTPSWFNLTVAHWTAGRVFAFHGDGFGSGGTTVDSYDPGTNVWQHLRKCDGASFVQAAYDTSGGRILVPPVGNAGGYLYAPGTNTWIPIAPAPLDAVASATTASGKLLVVTMSQEGRTIAPGDAALWDPRTDTWAKPPPLPVTPETPVATSGGGQVFVWTGNDGAPLYSFTE